MKNESFVQIIQIIEVYCNKNKLDHRFVGGVSFGGLVNKNSRYDIDIDKRTVRLYKYNPLELFRKDGTIKDIDIILFCNDKKSIRGFKDFITKLEREAWEKRQPFPQISAEATIYPSFGRRDEVSQFVTALEVDKNNQLYLAFEDIKQPISWQSVEPWRVILENKQSFTVRNPIADYNAYFLRSPGGLKPKDAKKIVFLKNLRDQVIEKGLEHFPIINYNSDDYYLSWKQYTQDLVQSRNIRVQLKILILRLYWNTIGTTLAHGKGLVGKTLSFFSNQFTGIKQ